MIRQRLARLISLLGLMVMGALVAACGGGAGDSSASASQATVAVDGIPDSSESASSGASVDASVRRSAAASSASGPSISPSPAIPGQAISISGPLTLGQNCNSCTVYLWLSTSPGGGALQQVSVNGVNFTANVATSIQASMTLSSTLALGTYYISSGIYNANGSQQYIGDYASFAVQAPTTATVSPNPAHPGQSITIGGTLSLGQNCNGCTVYLWLAASPGGTALQQVSISGVNFTANQPTSIQGQMTLPSGLAAGTYYVADGIYSGGSSLQYNGDYVSIAVQGSASSATGSSAGTGSSTGTVSSAPISSSSATTPSGGGSSPSGSSSSASTSSSSAAPPTGADSVTLTWTAPTQNTDGSALTDLAGYEIFYGNTAGAMTNAITVNTVGMLTYVVTGLSPGTWYFTIRAVNSAGVRSPNAGVVSITL
jgi:hypothetical protein